MPVGSKFELRALEFQDGRRPFEEWFDELQEVDQYMVDNRLMRVRLGNLGDHRDVGQSVWELKFHKGRALRIYFAQISHEVILLITGGDKRTQRRDIKKARELYSAYRLGENKDAKR